MPLEKGRKGTNGGRNLETLVKLAAPAIGTAAGAFTVVGIIYLGMTLAGLLRGGGGEIRKAVAIIVAGLTCIAFAQASSSQPHKFLTVHCLAMRQSFPFG